MSSSSTKMAAVDKGIMDDKISYIGVIPVLLDISFSFYASMFTSPFRGQKGAITYRRAVFYAALREVISGFSVAEGQKFTPNTDKVYRSIAKSKGWKAHTVDFKNGGKGHWLGHSNAKYVMLYIHGGGYISAATPGHLKYQFALQKQLRKLGHDFSILSLSYTLAPKAVYPTQINQAAAALRYLVFDQKRDPSTIIIAGDSAGGNLVTAILSHIAHPHPQLAPLDLGGRLGGAVMISPWISFSTSDPSFKENAKSDILTTSGLDRASNTYIGPGGRHDNYTEPVRAPPQWWAPVTDVVDEILIWGGGGEILIDSIRRFAANLKAGFQLAEQKDSAPVEAKTTTEHANGEVKTTTEHANGDSKTTTEHANGDAKTTTEHANGEAEKHDSVSATPPFGTPRESPSAEPILPDDSKPAPPDAEEKALDSQRKERAKFVESPRMAHEEMILDYILRMRGKKKRHGARAIEVWMDNLMKEG